MIIYTVIDTDGDLVANVGGSNAAKAILRAEFVLDDTWSALQDEGYRLVEAEVSIVKIFGPVDIDDLPE